MKKTIINPPSTFPPCLHSRSLAVSHHRFLPPAPVPSVPPTFYSPSPLPCLTSSLPPSLRPLAPSVPPTFYSPSPLPCLASSLPPSLPPLAPSVPPTFSYPSLLPCPSLPACLLPCNSTPCVYTVLVSCTGYCVGSAQPGGVTQPGVTLRQWSGRAISRWLAVTLATHPTTNPFLTNSKQIRRSKRATNTHKHGRSSYLSVGTGGDVQTLLKAEPLRSKDRGLFTYNIDNIDYSKRKIAYS